MTFPIVILRSWRIRLKGLAKPISSEMDELFPSYAIDLREKMKGFPHAHKSQDRNHTNSPLFSAIYYREIILLESGIINLLGLNGGVLF